MRGVEREDKKKACEMLNYGVQPTVVARELGIPPSTILTWYGEIKRTRKRSPGEIRNKLKENSTCLNISEARILAAASKVINPAISDEQWFEFQTVVTQELKNLIIKNT